jgi:hypothetical protein
VAEVFYNKPVYVIGVLGYTFIILSFSHNAVAVKVVLVGVFEGITDCQLFGYKDYKKSSFSGMNGWNMGPGCGYGKDNKDGK